MSTIKFDQSRTAWISRGFEQLVADKERLENGFDILIIGSGYGGAIAADTFSQYSKPDGGKLEIAVLERGDEYLSGAFPANSTELPAHVRYGRQTKGLFDFRGSPDVGTLVANGVGGGSLINAGVMIEPKPSVFRKGWPIKLSNFQETRKYYDQAALLLGSRQGTAKAPESNSVDTALEGSLLAKHGVARRLAPDGTFRRAEITIAGQDGTNSANVQLQRCIRCGDCVTGCNHGAKNSLDLNLLYRAHRRGVTIYRGATVIYLTRDDDNDIWEVHAVHTDHKLRRLQGELVIPARRVVVAAGTLGSTEILKRSESHQGIVRSTEKHPLVFSRWLGQRVSANGDAIITHFATESPTKAVGDESVQPKSRHVGPTITSVVDLRDHRDPRAPELHGLLIEEMASPAPMQRVFRELYTTANLLNHLGERDGSIHEKGIPEDDLYEARDDELDRTGLYAVMGDDGASGEIEVKLQETTTPQDRPDIYQDGVASIRWPGIRNHPLFDRQVSALERLARESGLGGKIIANPFWQILPEDMQLLTAIERGPLITVHPLGGCAMADSSTDGVVNHLGQVFRIDDKDDTKDVHEGLVVLDGAIIPTSLSANPALTIAALALRASCLLAEGKGKGNWGYVRTDGQASYEKSWDIPVASQLERESKAAKNRGSNEPSFPIMGRPVYRESEATNEAFEPDPTMIRVTERMSGPVRLRGFKGVKDYVIELTLRFEEKALRELTSPSASPETLNAEDSGITINSTKIRELVRKADRAKLIVDTDSENTLTSSKIRIYDGERFDAARRSARSAKQMEKWLEEAKVWGSPIESGSLTIFSRQASHPWQRIIRAGWAWFWNHGLRDIWQAVRANEDPGKSRLKRIKKHIVDGIALASRSGECRQFEYELHVRDGLPRSIAPNTKEEWVIRGEKRFTYGLASNPWNQLMQLELTEFPGLLISSRKRQRALKLDLAYLAHIRVPLLEITRENDGVTAIAELGSFLAYIARLTVGIHAWSFRAPDEPGRARVPKRLPDKLLGIPTPEIYEIHLGKESPRGAINADRFTCPAIHAYVRLTRYPCPASTEPPLVMMHGYSASGTTFAHPSVKGNFVRYFHGKQRDVWVIDFRTSCGMPTAREPWSFEQIAYRDIPEAIKFVSETARPDDGPQQVDIIAHCMSAAMLSMAILHSEEKLVEYSNPEARKLLPDRIRRVAFTQVSPLVVLSPANIFRGYVLRFLRELLPDTYEFNPGLDATVADRLLDRFLTTLPYPKEEFLVENPRWPCAKTPWTLTRHRMDALYGRAFNARKMDKAVLNKIDDFFGPMSIDTVSQTIHFARYNMITDVSGVNSFISHGTLVDRWGDIPLFMVTAEDNGLADMSTAHRTRGVFRRAGRWCEREIIRDGAGHQDCLIGVKPREETLSRLTDFFNTKEHQMSPTTDTIGGFVAYPPFIGPVLSSDPHPDRVGIWQRTFRVGASPTLRHPIGLVLTRVRAEDRQISPAEAATVFDRDYLLRHSVFIKVGRFREERWETFRAPPQQEGNAWLVAIIYNEKVILQNVNDDYYRYQEDSADDDGEVAFPLDPGSWEYTKSMSAASMVVKKAIDQARKAIQRREFDEIIESWRQLLEGQLTANASGDDPGYGHPVSPDDTQFDLNDEDHGELADGLIPDPPATRPDEVSFLLSSCQYPAGLIDSPLAYRSYQVAVERCRLLGTEQDLAGDNRIVPHFGVFAGDQIYADASAGLFDPSVKDGRFELPYQRWLGAREVSELLRQIPSYMLLDDHEIDDNWEPLAEKKTVPKSSKLGLEPQPGIGKEQQQRKPAEAATYHRDYSVAGQNDQLRDEGYRAYLKYQRGLRPDGPAYPFGNTGPFHFRESGFDFYMLDTRSARGFRGKRPEHGEMVADAEIDALLTWISDRQPRPVFVVTPSMVLPRHRVAAQWDTPQSALRSDGWDGYPRSLFRLLAGLADMQAQNVVFLSGDEHIACLAEFVLTTQKNTAKTVVHSVHTAAANAPYTFANAKREQHMDSETLHFRRQTKGKGKEKGYDFASDAVSDPDPDDYDYHCRVKTYYPKPGDAMTFIRLWQETGQWGLRCEFASDVFVKPDISVEHPPVRK